MTVGPPDLEPPFVLALDLGSSSARAARSGNTFPCNGLFMILQVVNYSSRWQEAESG
jgi:hypothetical protein